MKIALATVAIAAAALPTAAIACPPPPPGYVPPTHEQLLHRFVGGSEDIVYGIVTRNPAGDGKSALKVLHVYKGDRRKGETVEATASWDLPVPFCAGMMTPPPEKPVGTYGVFALRGELPELNLIRPDDVQLMIRNGWIRSARAR